MIVWLTAAAAARRASGSCTLNSVCSGVAPSAFEASTVSAVTPRMPERGDAHRRRDRVDHRADHRRGRADREQDHDRHQVRERGHDLHRVERRRDRAVHARERPAQMPIGTPTSSESDDRGEHQRERLHALLPQPHQRERDERGEHDRAPARQPPKRSTISMPAAAVPTHVIHSERVGERGDEPVRERAEAVEDREDRCSRSSAVRCVDQPALEVVELAPAARSRSSAARPRELAAQQREGEQHEQRRRGRPAPGRPRHRGAAPEIAGAASRSLATATVAPRGAGHRLRAPTTRSTTPTTRPPSTARTGPSCAATTGTASLTVVATSSSGPVGRPRRAAARA